MSVYREYQVKRSSVPTELNYLFHKISRNFVYKVVVIERNRGCLVERFVSFRCKYGGIHFKVIHSRKQCKRYRVALKRGERLKKKCTLCILFR